MLFNKLIKIIKIIIQKQDILFYSNLYPYFQDDKYGCMQWTWTLECDLQLFLLVPLFVISF